MLHDWNDAHCAGVNAREAADKVWTRPSIDDGEPFAGERKGRALISRCASDIEPEPVEWLWPGRIARGKHTCIAGEPGTGKSQLSIAIIGAITTGGAWPCGEGQAPLGSVIILSAEDGEADTIVPRLMAAGADLSKIHIITAVRSEDGKGRRAFNLQADLDLLERKIVETGDVALVTVDPISSYLGKTDSHKNAEVRGVLEPIGEMAERMRVAVLSITHFSKAGAGNTTTRALHKFIGSIAFVGAPRAAFAVIEDADDKDRRLFLHAKNNLAAPPQGLAFRLVQTIVGEPGKGIVASCVKWEAMPVTMTADAALASDSGEVRNARAEAKDFLQEVLADGPVPVSEVNDQADALGIAEKTLKRARAELNVKAAKIEFSGGWTLSLPEGGQTTPKGAS
jgi:putative DNA primase/helicase